jgi:hypothetical protein
MDTHLSLAAQPVEQPHTPLAPALVAAGLMDTGKWSFLHVWPGIPGWYRHWKHRKRLVWYAAKAPRMGQVRLLH